MIQWLQVLPPILWFLFAVVIFVLFFKHIRDGLLPNLSSFEAAGLKFSFVKDSIDACIELAEKSPQWNVQVPASDKQRVLARIKRHLKVLKGAQILWIDDYPENNLNERRMFSKLNVNIDIAINNKEGLDLAKRGCYDLVFSDIGRDDEKETGLDFLNQFREWNSDIPVIFYVGVIEPDLGVPGRAFGITNRPDELLHLTLDALERKRP